MPIYEYQCAACGRVLEKWQKFSDEPLKSCPVCGGPLSKLISSCAFHLKGNGWYATDYSGSHSSAVAPGNATQGTKEAAAPSGEPAKSKEGPRKRPRKPNRPRSLKKPLPPKKLSDTPAKAPRRGEKASQQWRILRAPWNWPWKSPRVTARPPRKRWLRPNIRNRAANWR